jgi:hypothetical protein
MATTTTRRTKASLSDLDSPLDPLRWTNHARRSRGLPLVTDAERDIVARRQEVYQKCEFTRQAQRVLALLIKVRDEVEALADMDEVAVITEAWAKAKLPPLADSDIDDDAERTLGEAEAVSRNASGCAWAMEQFITMLDGAIPGAASRHR